MADLDEARKRAERAKDAFSFGPDSIYEYRALGSDVLALAARVEELQDGCARLNG